MKYNFDEIVDRRNTNSMKMNGFREYLFANNPEIRFPCLDDELVKMWIADMEFATPQVIIDKMKDRLDNRIFGYTKIFDESYYNSFAKWTEKKYGWKCNKSDLVTSPGIIPALYELIGLITEVDEKVLISTPAYGYFKYAADFNKRELVCSSLIKDEVGKFTMDFADLQTKLKDPKITLFMLCNPHNPNGIVWSKEDLQKIGQMCIDNNVWIISDEIHCDLLRTGSTHIPLAKLFPNYDKLITAMAPSKTFNLAGMMLSNIIIPSSELMGKWKNHHFDFENPVSVAAVQAAYEYGDEWLDELKLYLDDNFAYLKQYLSNNLPQAKFSIPDATYLAWIDLSEYFAADEDLTVFFAEKAGVLLEAGNQFVQDGNGYIRLNLACPRAMLKTALDKITLAINNR